MHTYCWFVQANSYQPTREYVIISLENFQIATDYLNGKASK